jgi:hypothetical protein
MANLDEDSHKNILLFKPSYVKHPKLEPKEPRRPLPRPKLPALAETRKGGGGEGNLMPFTYTKS